jgi:hypothetical protein
MKKIYTYTGTVKFLIERGFSITNSGVLSWAIRQRDFKDQDGIVILLTEPKRVFFNFFHRTDDIEPYIKDILEKTEVSYEQNLLGIN